MKKIFITLVFAAFLSVIFTSCGANEKVYTRDYEGTFVFDNASDDDIKFLIVFPFENEDFRCEEDCRYYEGTVEKKSYSWQKKTVTYSYTQTGFNADSKCDGVYSQRPVKAKAYICNSEGNIINNDGIIVTYKAEEIEFDFYAYTTSDYKFTITNDKITFSNK